MNKNCPTCGDDLTDVEKWPIVQWGWKAWCGPRCMLRDLKMGEGDDLPEPDHDKLVVDTYREYKDRMSERKLIELNARVSDEMNRRAIQKRKEAAAQE